MKLFFEKTSDISKTIISISKILREKSGMPVITEGEVGGF